MKPLQNLIVVTALALGFAACTTGVVSGGLQGSNDTSPPAPVGLAAAPGDQHVVLTWTTSAGATSYNVQRATTAGGPYALAGTPSTATYSDAGLSNDTTYYYVVSAVNAVGESANSSEVSATPVAATSAPPAPTDLTATAGDTTVALTWTASANAASYTIKRATTASGPYAQVGTPAATAFIDAGVTNGTTYYYVVTAVNSAGESPDSNRASATPVGGPPVNQPPVAALAVTPRSGPVSLLVNADTAGSTDADGTIVSVTIDFGDGTTISTASGSHTYTAAGVYSVVATVTDDDGATGTKSVQVMVSSSSSTVIPSLVASRTTGYAPLAVHFDATAASSTVSDITNPADGGTFRQIKHAFDFGDPGSGTHSIDGLSKNSEPSGGGLAAHVFETAGTYTVTVISTDGPGSSATATVTITVSDPSTLTTYAISKTGDFTGAPVGSTHLTQNNMPDFESSKRYFFHRGEDWSSSEISIQDPLTNVHVDAYGTGENPIFGQVAVGTDRPNTTNFATDIRISNITSRGGFAQENGGHVLFYKCSGEPSSYSGAGYTHVDSYGTLAQSAYTNAYGVFFVDCQLFGSGTEKGYAYYGNGSRLVFLNTSMGAVAEGTIRIVGWERGIMRHCQIEGPYKESSVHALKLHAGGPNPYADNWLESGGQNGTTSNYVNWITSKVVIANNIFGGGNGGAAIAAWTIAICPQNDGYGLAGQEPIEDVILEGNTFIRAGGWGGSNLDIAWAGRRLTSRNNSVQGGGTMTIDRGHAQSDAYDGPYFTD